jgi:hypothetical protein
MSRARKKTSRTNLQRAGRPPRSYTPLADALSQPLTFADTELAEGLQRHSLVGLLRSALGRQRRPEAEPLPNVLCALLVWPLLKAKSLHCFCAELCQILAGQVSVLYDFLGREDINWRGLASELARRGLPALGQSIERDSVDRKQPDPGQSGLQPPAHRRRGQRRARRPDSG